MKLNWPQTSSYNGHIIPQVRTDYFVPIETSDTLPTFLNREGSAAISPPLSLFELQEIHQSEREFEAGQGDIYESAEVMIASLRAERELYQRSHT